MQYRESGGRSSMYLLFHHLHLLQALIVVSGVAVANSQSDSLIVHEHPGENHYNGESRLNTRFTSNDSKWYSALDYLSIPPDDLYDSRICQSLSNVQWKAFELELFRVYMVDQGRMVKDEEAELSLSPLLYCQRNRQVSYFGNDIMSLNDNGSQICVDSVVERIQQDFWLRQTFNVFQTAMLVMKSSLCTTLITQKLRDDESRRMEMMRQGFELLTERSKNLIKLKKKAQAQREELLNKSKIFQQHVAIVYDNLDYEHDILQQEKETFKKQKDQHNKLLDETFGRLLQAFAGMKVFLQKIQAFLDAISIYAHISFCIKLIIIVQVCFILSMEKNISNVWLLLPVLVYFMQGSWSKGLDALSELGLIGDQFKDHSYFCTRQDHFYETCLLLLALIVVYRSCLSLKKDSEEEFVTREKLEEVHTELLARLTPIQSQISSFIENEVLVATSASRDSCSRRREMYDPAESSHTQALISSVASPYIRRRTNEAYHEDRAIMSTGCADDRTRRIVSFQSAPQGEAGYSAESLVDDTGEPVPEHHANISTEDRKRRLRKRVMVDDGIKIVGGEVVRSPKRAKTSKMFSIY